MSDTRAPLVLIIVSGISGAGKTAVLNALEDVGYYCIDTLPVGLLGNLFDGLMKEARPASRIAVGIDARNAAKDLAAVPDLLHHLGEQAVSVDLIFVEAEDDVLTKRFSETRRKHPLTADSINLVDALRLEREALGVIADRASMRLDTSRMHLVDLRRIVHTRIAREDRTNISVQFVSFAFKNGVPRDADFVFDVRYLPNPYWHEALCALTGKDQEIISFFEDQESVQTLLAELKTLLSAWIPRFEAHNRSYICIAMGCTGGLHRSVYMTDRLTEHFAQCSWAVSGRHRDMPN